MFKSNCQSRLISKAYKGAIRISANTNGCEVVSTKSAKRAKFYKTREEAGQRMSMKIAKFQIGNHE